MLNHESVMLNLFQHLFRADFLAYLFDIPINIGHFGNFGGMRQIRNIKGGSFDPPFTIYALCDISLKQLECEVQTVDDLGNGPRLIN